MTENDPHKAFGFDILDTDSGEKLATTKGQEFISMTYY
jgi:hypothetical protein